MPIVDFLLKHWFILIVLYVLFCTLVKRFRPADGTGQRPRPSKGMPSFGGGGQPGWPEARTGTQRPAMSKAAPAKAKPVQTGGVVRQADVRAEAAPSQTAPLREARAARLGPKPELEAAVSIAGEAPAAIGPITAQDAARGVLWAEILGPPRARRPYRR